MNELYLMDSVTVRNKSNTTLIGPVCVEDIYERLYRTEIHGLNKTVHF
jgi:hypothetical protein